jgi:hypothetical protein
MLPVSTGNGGAKDNLNEYEAFPSASTSSIPGPAYKMHINIMSDDTA